MNKRRIAIVIAAILLLIGLFSVTSFAAAGDVASAVESTWTAAKEQIKNVVNKVVFPALDLILAVLFFVKVGPRIWSIANTGSSNLPDQSSCSRA